MGRDPWDDLTQLRRLAEREPWLELIGALRGLEAALAAGDLLGQQQARARLMAVLADPPASVSARAIADARVRYRALVLHLT